LLYPPPSCSCFSVVISLEFGTDIFKNIFQSFSVQGLSNSIERFWDGLTVRSKKMAKMISSRRFKGPLSVNRRHPSKWKESNRIARQKLMVQKWRISMLLLLFEISPNIGLSDWIFKFSYSAFLSTRISTML
jgi:hypothetical protein